VIFDDQDKGCGNKLNNLSILVGPGGGTFIKVVCFSSKERKKKNMGPARGSLILQVVPAFPTPHSFTKCDIFSSLWPSPFFYSAENKQNKSPAAQNA
jgi:hypothetical protein